MNILDIGNSFGRDATAYLVKTLKASGVDAKVVNLYIGGCSLERHWQNIEGDKRDYQYQLNGEMTDRYVSISEVLKEETWDYIVTQQASHDSGWIQTYEPFLPLICDYLRKEAPQATICLQQTWAYETDSPHPNFMRYHRDQALMYEKLNHCYRTMAEKYGLLLIPCGTVIQTLRGMDPFRYQAGGRSLCRDGFHMDFLYGRYALSLTWAKAIAGVDALSNTFTPHDAAMPHLTAEEELLHLIRQVVAQTE